MIFSRLIFLSFLVFALTARATEVSRSELTATSAAGLVWLISDLLKPALAPDSCRWCDRNLDGSDGLNGFDRAARNSLRWGNADAAGTLSGLIAYGILPLATFGTAVLEAPDLETSLEDAFTIAQTAIFAGLLNQATKYISGRQRPYAHYGTGPSSSEDNLSFFSGHTSLAFSLAVSGGMIATLRKSPVKAWVWGAGLTAAAATAYFRVAADQHYLTDVIVGALVGSAAGYFLPLLRENRVASIEVGPGQMLVRWQW